MEKLTEATCIKCGCKMDKFGFEKPICFECATGISLGFPFNSDNKTQGKE